MNITAYKKYDIRLDVEALSIELMDKLQDAIEKKYCDVTLDSWCWDIVVHNVEPEDKQKVIDFLTEQYQDKINGL